MDDLLKGWREKEIRWEKKKVQECLGIVWLEENEYSTMGHEDNRGKGKVKFL